MYEKTISERVVEAMEKTRRQWEAQRQLEAEHPLTHSASAFTIAVSREAGADASLVARAVAERLGWPVFDRELLQRVAEEMGLRASLLEGVDEKQKGWLQECLESALTSAPTVNEAVYVRHLLETMFSLSAHGQCVIVGRGATQVLPTATTLRVRLVAAIEDRIATIRQRLGIGRAEAVQWIEKTDRERMRFVKDHFQKDVHDLRYYDLVLNTSRFSVLECADLIVEALYRLQAHARIKRPDFAMA